MPQIQAADLKVGDRIIDGDGKPVTVTKIREGDCTDFGKIAKFWSPNPLTVWFKNGGGETLHCVVARSDVIEAAALAKKEG